MDIIEQELNKKKEISNFYRKKNINGKFFLSTDHGTWVLLTPEQNQAFEEGKLLDEDLHKDLVERGFLITPSNYDQITEEYYSRYDYLDRGASLHIIVPTIRCNLRCTYCHSEAASVGTGSRFDMGEDTVEKTLEFIFKSPNKRITIEFQGGEPLLNKSAFMKVINYSAELNQIYQKEYSIALVTNLTEMDEELLEFISANREQIHVCTSLDGPEHVHNTNRKYVQTQTGTYQDVVKWIRRFQEEKIPLSLLMVTTRYSLAYWKEIVDEYVKWGQMEIQLKPLDYLGYAVSVWSEVGYTMSEFNDFWKKSVDYMFELLDQGVVISERYLIMALRNLMYRRDINYLDLASPCGLIRGQIVYNYNGDIYCCDEARVLDHFIIGNVHTDTYNEVIQQDRSKELIVASMTEGHYCDSCAYKPFCGVCPVLNYAQEGSYNIKLNKSNRCLKNKLVMDYAMNKIISERHKIRQLLAGNILTRMLHSIH